MMEATFFETPSVFGMAHIISLVIIAVLNIAAFFILRNLDEKRLLSVLRALGSLMILAEIFKQWFCYVYVFNMEVNLWFFPWQLCSMAMYLSFAAIYLKGKIQIAALVFLATYSLFADLVALALPYDMLRPQIALFIHSFAYHGLVITESMIAIMILSKKMCGRKQVVDVSCTDSAGKSIVPSASPKFMHATVLFLAMAAIAEVINVASHVIFNDIHVEPNMFYITPFYPTTQPILHDIAVNYGVAVEIVLYLALIILMSYIVFVIEKKALGFANE